MANDIAIRVSHLGKKYRLGQREPYRTLAETITNTLKAPFRSLNSAENLSSEVGSIPVPPGKTGSEEFWALKDVSFEVKKGEVVGIIGRNGAGKSTLLKILSRITTPTEGEVELHGRVGSLLEVGTGFHPELTGRENIFLSGSLLGMKKQEIEDRFDYIVKFAEIEQFLDTPVKRYSSGMYVRLGFAVAAHLEPEILLIDEVLAVGDATFQKKCLGKMGELAESGRTVLFVSHNISSIRQLCSSGMLIENGHKKYFGDIKNVLQAYLQSYETTKYYISYDENPKNNSVYIKEIAITDKNNNPTGNFFLDDDIKFIIHLKKLNKNLPKVLAINIKTSDGLLLSNIHSRDGNFSFDNKREEDTIEIIIKNIPYYPGNYFVSVILKISDEKYITKNDCVMFNISQHESITQRPLIQEHGLLFLKSEWRSIHQ